MSSEGEVLTELSAGIPLSAPAPPSTRDASVPHAPRRTHGLSTAGKVTAVKNALRYFPVRMHKELVTEFAAELEDYGHIYMYRFRPLYDMRARHISCYPAKCRLAAAIMLMIQNNLDPRVAQFPHELITYGGNGSVFSNWAQYHLTMKYLSEVSTEQTLVLQSGHPLGIFPSPSSAPRLVITNGMMIPNYSTKQHYDEGYALGVTQYGQMTAGSFCYIGPQGIVHGTTLTVLNASRKYLKRQDLTGVLYVTAGLGGMSGAQPKAAEIAGCIGVVAEVSRDALEKRYKQGWVNEVANDLDECITAIRKAKEAAVAGGKGHSIAYHGNVVDLWERLAVEPSIAVELGSDQTSLHNAFGGGYYPVGLTVEEANALMVSDPDAFKVAVQKSLIRHVAAVNKCAERGMHFWDYGNAFLLEAGRAGANIFKGGVAEQNAYKYPSYVQDIMGDIFSLGFGPFRWVCTGGEDDLAVTDTIAAEIVEALSKASPVLVSEQYNDNLVWIRQAGAAKLVVGSAARILYSDAVGRASLAEAFNTAIREGRISAPIVLSRDHHDVSGTDSPFRETSDITDGSVWCADMSVQNCIGDAARGATWVSLHNGGGVGWGEVMNGGFGLVLDGSADASSKAASMLDWDVNNGVSRRAWAGNSNANFAIRRAMEKNKNLTVTVAEVADPSMVEAAVTRCENEG